MKHKGEMGFLGLTRFNDDDDVGDVSLPEGYSVSSLDSADDDDGDDGDASSTTVNITLHLGGGRQPRVTMAAPTPRPQATQPRASGERTEPQPARGPARTAPRPQAAKAKADTPSGAQH